MYHFYCFYQCIVDSAQNFAQCHVLFISYVSNVKNVKRLISNTYSNLNLHKRKKDSDTEKRFLFNFY